MYGSSDYAPWKADADAKISNGTFVNMANSHNSANVGTTNFNALDEIVYSTGDLGTRLHFLYFIEDTTVAELESANLEKSA